MALSILSPTVSKAIADGEAAQRTAQTGTTVTATDWTTQVFDSASTSPTFDTQHEVYTTTPQDAATQNATGDNRNGVEPTLTLTPTWPSVRSAGSRRSRRSPATGPS